MTSAQKIIATTNICPDCGRTTFVKRWDGVECVHCGRYFDDVTLDNRPAINILLQCPDCDCHDFAQTDKSRLQCMDCKRKFDDIAQITGRKHITRHQRIKPKNEAAP